MSALDERQLTSANPYEILGIDPEASTAEIKKAYLAQVRAHSPEKDPAGFKAIRQAYESLKDDKSRVAVQMESPGSPPFMQLEDRPLWNGPFTIDWKRFAAGDPAHDLTRIDFEADTQMPTLDTATAKRQEG